MRDYTNHEDKFSLRERVYNALREDILNGKYKIGDNLIEMKIAAELNVSRTPVREAVRQLEFEGLVESIPNKGVTVKGITEKDIEDIYKIRVVLEELSVKWALKEITDEDIKKLQDVYELMEFYTAKGDVNQIAALNTKFHEIIFNAAKSNVLKNILRDFQFYVKLARHESLTTPGRKEEALREHFNILSALKERNLEEAVSAITVHVRNSSRNIIK